MNRPTQIIIVALIVVIVGLGVTVGVMAADDDDGDGPMSGHIDSDDAFMGMMGAMASMDSDGMLSHMRDVLGEDGYQRMLTHFADHRDGGPMTSPAIDEMMHSMMDGMMQHMPTDEGDVLPPSNDEHHETPSP